MLKLGELTMSEIAAELGVGRSILNHSPARHVSLTQGQRAPR